MTNLPTFKSQGDQKHGEKLKCTKNTTYFQSNVTHLPTYLAEDSQKGFSELFLSSNQMESYNTKPEVYLSREECTTQPYMSVDKRAVTHMTGICTLTETLVLLIQSGPAILCTVMYILLPATGRGREEARHSVSFTPLLTQQLMQQKLSQ
jgi:hypothetical protein